MNRVKSPPVMTDRQLLRVVRLMLVVLVAGTIAFTAYYYLDSDRGSGPTLIERQIARAEDAIRSDPSNVIARLGLAGLYLAALRYGDAADQFGEVISVQPENRIALSGRARAMFLAGETTGARELFQQVVEISEAAEFSNVDPAAQEAHYYLGLIARDERAFDVAVDEFQAAVTMESMDADAYYQLGRTYLDMGDPEAAVEPLCKAILYVPVEWRDPYVALADAYAGLGRQEAASYAAAMATFVDGDAASARATLEGLVTADASPELLLGLGIVTEALDDRDAAMSWYAKALVGDPDNVSAQQGFLRMGGDGLTLPQGVDLPQDGGVGGATPEPALPVTAQAED